MKIKSYKVIITAILIIAAKLGFAQYDLNFTQYMFNETFINPAYTGSQEALSLSASYRNQWIGVEGAPISQTLVAHTPLPNKKIGVGLAFANEKAGVLNRTAAYGNFAYRIIMNKSTFAFGLLAGIQSTREELSKIKTSDKIIIDPAFASNSPTFLSPNFGFGMYYYNQKFYAGVSIPRFIKTSIIGEKAISTIAIEEFNYYIMAGYLITINDNLKLKPSFMSSFTKGLPLNTTIAVNSLLKNVLWLGVAYKTSNTISGLVGFQISPQFKVSYSYDYTLNKLRTQNSGSHEIHVGYLFSFSKEKITTPRLF
ncbi:MAG: type IX secretion system membrane protein PorP/SprF [Bacteroidia bacterium]